MVTCNTAQIATLRLTTRTWVILGLMLAAHIAGYVIISTQVQSRFA